MRRSRTGHGEAVNGDRLPRSGDKRRHPRDADEIDEHTVDLQKLRDEVVETSDWLRPAPCQWPDTLISSSEDEHDPDQPSSPIFFTLFPRQAIELKKSLMYTTSMVYGVRDAMR